MPPKGKDSKKNAKQGTPLKEIIPVSIKQPPREPKISKAPEFVPNPQKINEYIPQNTPEDWPGDEVALAFDFGVDAATAKPFTDPTKFSLPPSLRPPPNGVLFWRRPKELLKNEAGNQGFSGFSDIGRSLQRKKTLGDLDHLDGRKRGIFLNEDIDYSSPSAKKEEFHVDLFQIYEREETQEEVERRLKEQAELAAKTKKKGGKKEEIIDTPQKVNDVKLSNIDLKNDLPAYSKWIASQLQLIKDRNIRDAHVRFL